MEIRYVEMCVNYFRPLRSVDIDSMRISRKFNNIFYSINVLLSYVFNKGLLFFQSSDMSRFYIIKYKMKVIFRIGILE